MSCRIHDASLTHRLTQALLHATKGLIAERDVFVDGATNSAGEYACEGDREVAASMDRDIDRYLELLAEAGAWPEQEPPK